MGRHRSTGVLMLASVALLGLDWPGQGAARAAEFAHAGATRRIELLFLLAPSAEPEARGAFASALTDPVPSVRETARRLAVRYASEALVPALVGMLADPDVDARTDALDALARTGSPDARRAIEGALSDRNAGVRAHAVRALASLGPTGVVALLDRVHDPEGDVRVAAADALGQIRDPRAALALVGISQDPIPEVRLAATRALGALGGEVAVRSLLGLVHDAAPEVRRAAVRGLQSSAAPSAVPTLVALARPNLAIALAGRDDLARSAITALASIDAPDARRALLDLALEVRAPHARDAIAALLPQTDRLVEELDATLPRVNAENVEALAELLGRIGGDVVADELLDLLGRVAPECTGGRGSAATAILRGLGRTGSDRALRALLERLARTTSEPIVSGDRCARSAPDPTVVEAIALWADRRTALDPVSVDPLAEALQYIDPSCHERRAAMLRLLSRTGNERAAATLVGSLEHPDPLVRMAAAEGLGRVRMPGGLAPLVHAMSDRDASVRAAAAVALRAHPAAVLAPALAARWQDPAAIDRGALLLAMGDAVASPDLPEAVRTGMLRPLVDAAATGPLRTRAAAVRALGAVAASGDPAAIRVVAAYTTDRRLAVVAIEALGNAPPTADTRSTLVSLLAASNHADVISSAAWALRWAPTAAAAHLVAVVERGAPQSTHNALAALTRSDLGGLDDLPRVRLRALVEALIQARPAPLLRTNACRALARLGGACADERAPMPTFDRATHRTDLRVVDVDRQPVDRPVLLRFSDGVSVWVTPDDDGWVRIVDSVPGAIEVLDRSDDGGSP